MASIMKQVPRLVFAVLVLFQFHATVNAGLLDSASSVVSGVTQPLDPLTGTSSKASGATESIGSSLTPATGAAESLTGSTGAAESLAPATGAAESLTSPTGAVNSLTPATGAAGSAVPSATNAAGSLVPLGTIVG